MDWKLQTRLVKTDIKERRKRRGAMTRVLSLEFPNKSKSIDKSFRSDANNFEKDQAVIKWNHENVQRQDSQQLLTTEIST